MEEYFAAKARLFALLGSIKKNGRAVINVDDAYGRQLIARLGGENAVLTYGVSSAATVRARDVRVSCDGSDFIAATPLGDLTLSLPLIGRFNVYNALGAIGAGLALGFDLAGIERGLSKMRPVPGRLERVDGPQGFHVFVDYAHTEDALRNVLSTVGELTKGRLIVVFGCGGDRDTGKRKPMGEAACELADYAILTSDNPRTEDPREILRQIEEGFPVGSQSRYAVIEDRREAIHRALELARPGDTVVLAGKGHETYQEFAHTVVPFNDRQVVEEYFNSLGARWRRCA
jgi:UDP-N-acetylmuramoyl-L-alanyl-D-glutamate--2,6-diaminopimelate ligase